LSTLIYLLEKRRLQFFPFAGSGLLRELGVAQRRPVHGYVGINNEMARFLQYRHVGFGCEAEAGVLEGLGLFDYFVLFAFLLGG
jgi:hypothetical protein